MQGEAFLDWYKAEKAWHIHIHAVMNISIFRASIPCIFFFSLCNTCFIDKSCPFWYTVVNAYHERIQIMIDRMTISQNLTTLRKAAGLTQSEVADKLHVSHQAISQWERGDTLPDILILPALSALFGVSVDHILGISAPQTHPVENQPVWATVEEDGDYTVVLEKNGERIQALPTDLRSQLVLVLEGSCREFVAYASAEVHGDVQGDVTISGGLQVGGNVTGEVVSSGGTTIQGDVQGDVTVSGGSIIEGNIEGDMVLSGTCTIHGDITGNVTTDHDLTVNGNIEGDIDARDSGTVTISGDIEGDVDCGPLHVEGDINGDVDSGSLRVEGDIYGDVDCGSLVVEGDLNGDVDCGNCQVEGDVNGDIDASGDVTVDDDVDEDDDIDEEDDDDDDINEEDDDDDDMDEDDDDKTKANIKIDVDIDGNINIDL